MLTSKTKKTVKAALVYTACSSLLLISLAGSLEATTTAAHSTDWSGTGSCLFTEQLASDPAIRAEFSAKLFAGKMGLTEEDNSDIYQSEIEAGNSYAARLAGNSSGIDTLSRDCLSCHDGVTAQNFKIRIKNDPNGRVMTLEDIIGGHPVGMEYDRYLNVKGKEYKSEVKFNSDVVFAEGKIGCLSCHNPLNKEKGHLVMNNSKSELCFACHSK